MMFQMLGVLGEDLRWRAVTWGAEMGACKKAGRGQYEWCRNWSEPAEPTVCG